MNNITIKVKVADLINALESNKAAHLVDYVEAQKGYFESLIKKSSSNLKAAKAANFEYDYNINLAKPILLEKTYDQYIGMFKMTTTEFLDIDSEQYRCFVEDQWQQAIYAKTINSSYSGRF